MRMRAPFESMPVEAQFQARSVYVWAICLAIVITAAKHWHHFHPIELAFALPVFHVLPWFFGLAEFRRVKKFHGTMQQQLKQEGTPEKDEVCLQSLIRVLWGAYPILLILEAQILWL